MLETKNLCKTYKPKKGVPVTAVDHISLRFPETGMVFLLGKSGSGKSTMLNLLGGLDQYDEGEIIIKGVSSRDFTQQHFDSYRNTYVGFIFQEYNVLEEFNVGANIALALELQGKTANDEEINNILKAVDLEGFGDRNPNELSGGQKQRVAIARALVKNPEIIMADEPTGALDSNTGRQVLDTLKKLSADHLVIIVSHDREYAEQYADRIIEMADGHVIRDVEAVHDAEQEEKSLIFRASTIEIPPDYHLTEEDRIRINEYLDQIKSGASVTLPSRSQRFRETDTEHIAEQDGSKFNLIKSVLPLKSAFKIGCSSLKHKKFRLVMTILLSVTAFTLFALVDTFSAYDHIRACTDSLIDSDVNYISVNKAVKEGSGTFDTWWSTYGQKISDADMETFIADTGIPSTGIFIPQNADLSFDGQFDPSYEFTKSGFMINMTHFCGFSEITQEAADSMHFKLIAGKLPDGSKNEIAVSEALCETFVKAGYSKPLSDEDYEKGKMPKYEKVASPVAMVGKVIRLMDTDYTITGVLDTDFDLSRYERLTEESESNSTADDLVNYLLYNEYSKGANYSLSGCAMIGKGRVQEMINEQPAIFEQNGNGNYNLNLERDNGWGGCYSQYYTTLDRIPDSEIIWLGDKKTELADDEVIVNLSNIEYSDNKGMSVFAQEINEFENGKTEANAKNIQELFDKMKGTWRIYFGWSENGDYRNYQHEEKDAKIVGCIVPGSKYDGAMVIPVRYMEKLVTDTDGIYDSIVGPMPEDRSGIEQFVRYCYRDGEDVTERYEINHAVTYELDTVNSALRMLAKVFFWIGIFFAVFAALLMANFITTSIHYKRQEIGILRALGARSADVFRIFFSESFVIAMIDFVISALLCFSAVTVVNYLLRTKAGILITVLHFGIRQILLLFVISIVIAALASFLPVHKIASKRPIDAIRDH
ncbi:MAG: ATP-binding cassette domain-containing protein [Oscillospiraceae bacterium]|nr:ATP-binding cassette domain-containing protein [Oscillospiraceae bacterium]